MSRRIWMIVALLCLALVTTVCAQEPATQPATQPAATEMGPQSLYDQLLRTQLAEIMRGKRALTWDDIRQPEFWYDSIKDLIITVVAFIPRLVGTLAFLAVFWLLYRGIRRMAMGSMKQGEMDSSIREMLGVMIKWLVMGFGIVIACNQLGIPIMAMLATVSLVGLAVGFAAQETLANFIAGVVIFIDKPFKIGDWIEMDGNFGQVKRVTFRSTRILTLDGEVMVVPNTHVLANRLNNHSTNPINRVTVPIGIAYKESIDRAREVLLGLTKNDERITKEPGPEVVVNECADSSVNLLLRFWIADEAIERQIGYEFLEKAKEALDEAQIQIPFPHMQLFMETTPALAALTGDGKSRGVN